ncbi:Galactose oxidase/kelch repeat superfamily protein [Prunus dulcis]|uniref:Galactose oxidase/kelch repeat superfamily protein n=1 Tax=Prunus dulcis TaxID=3755 RepID=A0A4Y1RI10_PRUDU|nr:Galactose oxidase/kelch repeat superfamily protein [Prunus dulcis]
MKRILEEEEDDDGGGEGLVFYVNMDDDLLVLDISKLLARSSPRPEFKLVHGSYFPDGRNVPEGMRYIIVNSKPYIVGGKSCPKRPSESFKPNLEVIDCEPTEGNKTTIPTTFAPKVNPVVVTIKDKIYVMSTEPVGYEMEEESPALFEVFDPVTGLWTVLPNPPFPVGTDVVLLNVLGATPSLYYVFDTLQNKWEEDDAIASGVPKASISRFAEFKNFLVNVYYWGGDVIAYSLDPINGIPKPVGELVELRKVLWQPCLEFSSTFVSHMSGDDGLMCIMSGGWDPSNKFCVRVVVFQLLVTSLAPGEGFRVNADIKANETYYFKYYSFKPTGDLQISSVAMTLDRSDKHDNKPGASCKNENLPKFDSSA